MKLRHTITLLALAFAILLWDGGGVIGSSAPYPADKLTVLVVEETESRQSLTSDQLDVLAGLAPGTLREYVATHGGEFRLLDKDNDVSFDAPWVQAAWKVADKSKLPSMVGSNGKRGFAPTPVTTTAEALKLVQPLGGK